ncbi:hypothetical protein [Halarchaeum sp. P4]|uniref:hypothetical protein n=1 Tax=Halarchaeum sp. P4 TaxID=3421639 RepID=UPI003EC0224F
MSADGVDVVGGEQERSECEAARIDVSDVSLAWVRSFVRDRDAHFERTTETTYLVLD